MRSYVKNHFFSPRAVKQEDPGKMQLFAAAVKGLLLILVALTLNNCGFKLRGQFELPAAMTFTYIDSRRPANTAPSALAAILARALRVNGVVVTDKPEEAGARLLVLNEDYRRRAIAAGGAGEVRQYDLNYNVVFMVALKDGKTLVPEQNVLISRDILYDETQVLGRVEGEELARQEMVRDAADAIMRRLQAVAAQ
jgi:LPS-assembly lipoprotein